MRNEFQALRFPLVDEQLASSKNSLFEKTMATQQDIQSDLSVILANFQDREYYDAISESTLFFGDLGFASIDAIVLGETLERHYGVEIPFQRFLKQLADEQVQDIAVGRLVEFLAEVLP